MHSLINWFTRNHVAANLLMVCILALGGSALFSKIPLEVFPSLSLNYINIQASFRGASPAEVEEGVTIRIEEAIQNLEGIKAMRSTASEGSTRVSVEVAKGYDLRNLMDDIKSRVDAINTFPADVENVVVSDVERRREVISVVVFGEVSEKELRQQGERVRDDLMRFSNITQVDLESVRAYEIAIEISESVLREYGLTLAEVASTIRKASIDLSAGQLKTQGGEILIRTNNQAERQQDFEQIVLLTQNDGRQIRLGNIAMIRDGFEEEPIRTRFNQQPAVMIEVYTVGNQSAIDIADTVKAYIEEQQANMPPELTLSYWRDRSKIVKGRLSTLLKSAMQGGVLILILLALFLRPMVAFWVCIGMPMAFMGGIALMPVVGVTLNVITLFAFILVLGIVVDDAIVTGENIYAHFKRSNDPYKAAIEGTQEVAVPVTFGVLTTVAAFVPLALVDGVRGAIFLQIPSIVIPVLLFSLVESKLILPAHLKHLKPIDPDKEGFFAPLFRLQRKIAHSLEVFVERVYSPLLQFALKQRYSVLALFIGITIIIISLIAAGWIRFIFFPRVQSEIARATLTMPVGTPFERTQDYINRITDAAQQLKLKHIDPELQSSVIEDILSTAGSTGGSGGGQSHVGRVMFEIVPPEKRSLTITSSELVKEWRGLIGELPGIEDLTFRAEIGRGGDPIDVLLAGVNSDVLLEVAQKLKQELRRYPSVFDVSDSFSAGKQELQFKIKPQAQFLGIELSDLASQIRGSFFGYEVQRLQRGRDDVRVMLRNPIEERQSLNHLYDMRIKTPDGAEVPFSEIAEIQYSTAPATIKRENRERTLNVTADLDKKTANIEAIKADIRAYLDDLLPNYPGVHYSLEGEAKEQKDSFQSLMIGLFFVLFAIYALLAIPFRSYIQPFIVMSVIPFGLTGAVIGHMIMGMDLTIMSVMGLLALIGVVVNDSLVMVDYVNRRREDGLSLFDAVKTAGAARFRPIILTSLTTFAGLMPLIFEKSTQAQFLIPMAVSLGFGILFATLATLIMIPVNYLILEDIVEVYR